MLKLFAVAVLLSVKDTPAIFPPIEDILLASFNAIKIGFEAVTAETLYNDSCPRVEPPSLMAAIVGGTVKTLFVSHEDGGEYVGTPYVLIILASVPFDLVTDAVREIFWLIAGSNFFMLDEGMIAEDGTVASVIPYLFSLSETYVAGFGGS